MDSKDVRKIALTWPMRLCLYIASHSLAKGPWYGKCALAWLWRLWLGKCAVAWVWAALLSGALLLGSGVEDKLVVYIVLTAVELILRY